MSVVVVLLHVLRVCHQLNEHVAQTQQAPKAHEVTAHAQVGGLGQAYELAFVGLHDQALEEVVVEVVAVDPVADSSR